MIRAPFDFDRQLKLGHLGEEFLMGAHAFLRRPAPGERRFDLIDDRPPFARVEVKTDQYPMGDTPNFFMERRTVIHRKGGMSDRNAAFLLGGPWRSARDGVDTFVYLYANGGTLVAPGQPVGYWFRDVPRLVATLDELITARPRVVFPRRVRNLRVSAQGFLVRREALLGPLGDSVEEIRYTQTEERTNDEATTEERPALSHGDAVGA